MPVTDVATSGMLRRRLLVINGLNKAGSAPSAKSAVWITRPENPLADNSRAVDECPVMSVLY